jgi:alginate O-acetyltransferase complex protein AlgI
MFGFELMENFNYPYVAQSMQDFWRRWHISLSTWFKEYLYFPLGGNRKGRIRTGINKVIVFFFTGLWHGAQWTFVIWGFFHGFFLMLESYGIVNVKKFKFAFLKNLYMLVVTAVGFVIFRAESLAETETVLKAMFAGFNFDYGHMGAAAQVLTPSFLIVTAVGIIACTPICPYISGLASKKRLDGRTLSGILDNMGYIISIFLLLLCIMALAASAYNPFIYFRF